MLGLAAATVITVVVTRVAAPLAAPRGEVEARVPRDARERRRGGRPDGAVGAHLQRPARRAASSFSGDEAGAYAAASVGARVLLLIAIAATTVLFPRIASAPRPCERAPASARRPGRRRRVRRRSRSSSLWVFAGTLVDSPSARSTRDAEAWLRPAQPRDGTLWPRDRVPLPLPRVSAGRASRSCSRPCFCAQLVAYALFHDTPSELIGVQLAFGAASVVAGELWYLLRIR